MKSYVFSFFSVWLKYFFHELSKVSITQAFKNKSTFCPLLFKQLMLIYNIIWECTNYPTRVLKRQKQTMSVLEPSVNCKTLERRETRHKSWTKRHVITERQIDKILWSIAQPPREHYVGGEQSSDSKLSSPPQLFHTASGQVQTSARATADELLPSSIVRQFKGQL